MPPPPTSSLTAMGTAGLAPKNGLASLLLGLDRRSLPVDQFAASSGLGWIAPLSLTAAMGLMLVALAQVAGMHGSSGAKALHGCGIAVMAFPFSLRLVWPRTPRSERILLVLILGTAFYGVKILHSPLHFALFDEHLHWVTSQTIMENRHLFGLNSLLPISELYPGLEIVTTALSNLSGLSIFAAGLIVIGLAKVAFLYALFLIAESVTGSVRVAALACVVFMSNPNFAAFHSLFAYESLAFVLMTFAFLAALRLIGEGNREPGFYLVIGAAFALAATVTHHLSSYFCAAVLTGLAMLKLMQGGLAMRGVLVLVLAAIAVTADLFWWNFTGRAGSGYLGPIFESGFSELLAFLTSPGSGRVPFKASDGAFHQEQWQKWSAMASFLLTCLGLATGFFRSLNLAGVRIGISRFRISAVWKNSGLVLLTLLTLGFPLSVLLRLTQSGWEVGNRLGTFVSLGVCIVVAIAIAGLWQGSSESRLRATTISVLLTIMIVGGFMLGWGPSTINYPYRVIADPQSIEPMGIGAAEWTRSWLGPQQRFATDRINQILVATYGRQTVISTQLDGFDVSGVVFGDVLAAEEQSVLKNAIVDYVMIDLRLTKSLPVLGVYFGPGEEAIIHDTPPEPAALLKFNKINGVSRVFDNGAMIIFDVRSLRAIN